MRIEPTKTARFWIYAHGWVRLALRPGQSVTHREGGPMEEGWSYETRTWSHNGDHLVYAQTINAQDCDGRLDQYYDAEATRLEDFYEHDSGKLVGPRPVWEDERSSQRDHTAEAMGY